MEHPDKQEMTLYIKTVDHKLLVLELPRGSRLDEVKRQISKKLLLPVTSQTLLFEHRSLSEQLPLAQQGVRDGSKLLLLARWAPMFAERREKVQRDREEENQAIISSILAKMKESSQRRRDTKLRALQTRRLGFAVHEAESLEVCHQNLLTLRQLLLSREPSPPAARPFRPAARRFRLGQWLDVKDTIDQWLEAEVIDATEQRVLVHYNGWGQRWDEWLEHSSPRVAFFRSNTVQPGATAFLSPVPAAGLSGCAAKLTAPLHALPELLVGLLPAMAEVQALLAEVAAGAERRGRAESPGRESKTGSARSQPLWEALRRPPRPHYASSMRERPSSELAHPPSPPSRTARSISSLKEQAEPARPRTGKKSEVIIEESGSIEAESSLAGDALPRAEPAHVKPTEDRPHLQLRAAQLAPLSDRLGRLLVDLAAHFALWGSEEAEEEAAPAEAAPQPQTLGLFGRFAEAEDAEPPQNRFQFRAPRRFAVPVMLSPGEVVQHAQLGHAALGDGSIDINLSVFVRSRSHPRDTLSVDIQTNH